MTLNPNRTDTGKGGSTEEADPGITEPPRDLARFLDALFAPGDLVLIRPIEAWTDPDTRGKKSRVVYQAVRHYEATRLGKVGGIWRCLLTVAERQRANLFFGVCPRFGRHEQYDLAWQVRTVRCLWADLDCCTVEVALQRCQAAGLPPPSIIVRSGNGVHLYWLLAEPYLIDDAGNPPPVYKEFIDRGAGKKKKLRYFLKDPETGEKFYQLPEVSPKGRRVEDVLAGMAAKVGGDHTQDLSRLLRLPCTLNRKDERNGKQPIPCELVECDTGRRYPFADFEPFAGAASDRAEAAKKMRLPKNRLTQGRRNKLNERINRCNTAPVGERSEADFALCCHAIREGLDREEVWALVKDVGKFAECGRDYFDRTWEKAEGKVRGEIYDRISRQVVKPGPDGAGHDGANGNGKAGGREEEGLRPLEADDDPHRLARIFAADYQTPDGPTLRYWQEDFYEWRQGAYRPLPAQEVRGLLTRRIKREFDRLNLEAQREQEELGEADKGPPLARKVSTRLVTDVLQALAGLTLLPSQFQPPAWLEPPAGRGDWGADKMLACRNVLVHLSSYVHAEPHAVALTPRFFSLNALHYDFDPEAPAPAAWLRFLADLWPDDQEAIDTLQEWFGYTLLPDTSQQKILIVVGPRRSGKGTVARVLRALVGIENTAGPTLAGLGTNFGLAPLLGKQLAIISDARLSGRTDAAAVTERLLSISGEDAQTVDRKNRSHVTCQLPTRFVILTNELPRLNDPSGALAGRMILLRQTRSWYGKEDTTLTPRLLAELPGILLWSIEGWERLQERGRFEQPKSGMRLVTELEDLASEVGAFVRECCVVGPAYSVFVPALYKRWKAWCDEKGKKDVGTEQTFGRDLHAALPGLDIRQPRVGGGRVRAYVGIGLKDPSGEAADEEDPPA